METYQEPQMAAEEELEEAPLFATPIEKLQVSYSACDLDACLFPSSSELL